MPLTTDSSYKFDENFQTLQGMLRDTDNSLSATFNQVDADHCARFLEESLFLNENEVTSNDLIQLIHNEIHEQGPRANSAIEVLNFMNSLEVDDAIDTIIAKESDKLAIEETKHKHIKPTLVLTGLIVLGALGSTFTILSDPSLEHGSNKALFCISLITALISTLAVFDGPGGLPNSFKENAKEEAQRRIKPELKAQPSKDIQKELNKYLKRKSNEFDTLTSTLIETNPSRDTNAPKLRFRQLQNL